MFNLAYNSTVLNQWTTTALVLSGIITSGHVDWPKVSAANECKIMLVDNKGLLFICNLLLTDV